MKHKTNEELLCLIGNIAHFGGLFGYSDPNKALTEIRKLTLNHYDREKLNKLQEKK
jgi:hypothetical protein